MLPQEDRLRGSGTHPLSVGACAREPQFGALTREESSEEGKVHPVRETAGMRVPPLQGGGRTAWWDGRARGPCRAAATTGVHLASRVCLYVPRVRRLWKVQSQLSQSSGSDKLKKIREPCGKRSPPGH